MAQTKTCSKCGEAKPVEAFRVDRSKPSGHKQPCKPCVNVNTLRWMRENKDRENARAKRRLKTLRAQVLAAYGGRCACCGETTPEFLSVDHIYNDGAQHRRDIGGGSHVYKWLRRNGFPKDRFQLLCHNCNFAKGSYGECPHERERRIKLVA